MLPADVESWLRANPEANLRDLRDLCSRSPLSGSELARAIAGVCSFLADTPASDASRDPALAVLALLAVRAPVDELALHVAALLPVLIANLDSDLPELSNALHLLWVADPATAESTLRHRGLSNPHAGVRLAATRELRKWIDGVGGRFAFRRFTPYYVRLLRDPDSAVRMAAYEQIVSFFSHAKQPAKDDVANIMAAVGIHADLRLKICRNIGLAPSSDPAAAKTVLVDVSAKAPVEKPAGAPSGDAIGAPGISPSFGEVNTAIAAPQISDLDEIAKMDSPELAHSNPAPPQSPEPSYLASALQFEIVHDKQYPVQPVSISWRPHSAEEFLDSIDQSLSCFDGKETDANWEERQRAVQRFRAALQSPLQLNADVVREALRLLARPLCEVLTSMRTTLVVETVHAIKDCAQLYADSPAFAEMFDPFYEPLARISAGVKRITSSLAHVAVCALIIASPGVSQRQFQAISQQGRSIKGFQRAHAMYWLKLVILTSYARGSGLADKQREIETLVSACLSSADREAREAARDTFWDVRRLWPEAYQSICSRVNPNVIRLMENERRGAKSADRLPTNSRLPANAMKPLRPQDAAQLPLRSNAATQGGAQSPVRSPARSPTPKPAVRRIPPQVPSPPVGGQRSFTPVPQLRPELVTPRSKTALGMRPLDASTDIPLPSRISSNLHTDMPLTQTVSVASPLPSDMPVSLRSDLSLENAADAHMGAVSAQLPSDIPIFTQLGSPAAHENDSVDAVRLSLLDLSVMGEESGVDDTERLLVDAGRHNDGKASVASISTDSEFNISEEVVIEVVSDGGAQRLTSSDNGPLSASTKTASSTSSSPELAKPGEQSLEPFILDFSDRPSVADAARKDVSAVLRSLASQQKTAAETRQILEVIKSAVGDGTDLVKIVCAGDMFVTNEERKGAEKLLLILDSQVGPRESSVDSQITSSPFNTPRAGSPRSNLSGRGESMSLDEDSVESVSDSEQQPSQSNSKKLLLLPSTETECRLFFDTLVLHVENGTATSPELRTLAALAIAMTTTQASGHSRPAIFIWKAEYAHRLAAPAIAFLLQGRNRPEVLLDALILLRAVLEYASVDATALLDALLVIDESAISAPVRDVLLPQLVTILLHHSESAAPELVGAILARRTSAGSSGAALRVKTLVQAICVPGRFPERVASLASQFPDLSQALIDAVQHREARVRKEIYPLMLALHGFENSIFDEVFAGMSSGQQRLLKHYLEIREPSAS